MAALHPAVVVTGATGAIGAATCEALARRGARLTLVGRPSRALDSLAARLGGTVEAADLSLMASVRAAARRIASTGVHVHALLHIAAVYSSRWVKTPDGFELMLATNHLAPFLLTNLLRDRLAGGGRVLVVTAPSATRVELDRLLDRARFSPLHSFAATKAANVLFTFELARRAKRWDVRANAFHPGAVRSRLLAEAPRRSRLVTRLAARSPERAANDLTELALSPAHAGTTGWFFKGTRRIEPPRQAADVGQQSLVWRRTAELVELEGGF